MGIGKKIIALFILSLTLPSLWGQVIDSPDRNLKLSFDVNNNGTPIYSLDYKNKVVLKKGGMGFVINDSRLIIFSMIQKKSIGHPFGEKTTGSKVIIRKCWCNSYRKRAG